LRSDKDEAADGEDKEEFVAPLEAVVEADEATPGEA
jgi:hypothetical protein